MKDKEIENELVKAEKVYSLQEYTDFFGLDRILVRLAKMVLSADLKQSKEAWDAWKNSQI